MDRIKQTGDDDCMAACVAMLTDYTLDEVKSEHELPMYDSDAIPMLEESYGHIEKTHVRSMEVLPVLAYSFETFIVSVRSPLRERDTELFADVLEKNRDLRVANLRERRDGEPLDHTIQFAREIADVYHAFVVHQGQIYDPQDPPYWPSLGSMAGDDRYEIDYNLHSVIVCMDEPVVETLDRTPAGYDDRSGLPEYD